MDVSSPILPSDSEAIDESPRPFPWDIRTWCLRRRFGFKLSFSYFLTTQAAIGPRNASNLLRGISPAQATHMPYVPSAIRRSAASIIRAKAPPLAGLPKQGLLSDAADGLVASVLRRVNIQRPCLACQPTEQPDSIFPPGLKLPPVLLNLCFFHSLHNSSSCVTKTPYE